MPTILRKDGFLFFFYLNEPRFKPPHIHCKYQDGMAIFWLDPVGLSKNKGLNTNELAKARRIVIEYREFFMEKYIEQFGEKNS